MALRAGDAVAANQDLAWIVAASPAPLDARSRAELKARAAAASSAEAEARANIERARIGRAQAEREVERSRKLAQGLAVSVQAVEGAEYELQARQKELSLAEKSAERAAREVEAARAALLGAGQLGAERGERLAVRAPVAGKVLRVLRDSEGAIAAGTPILEIGDPGSLEAVLDLLTTQAVRVRPGAKAHLERWGGREDLQAHVESVEPSGFTKVSALGVEEQRINVLLAPPEGASWGVLADGYHVEARILVYERSDALKAPAGALFRKGGEWAGFVVKDGKAALRTVKAGESDGEVVEVLAGLSEGERLVLHPSDKIAEGVAVKPL